MSLIELGEDQSAKPVQCGSCEHFRHRQAKYDTMGICSVLLSPWVRRRGDEPDACNEVDPRTVTDTDTCSLYEPRGGREKPDQFVQRHIWTAGQ